VSPSVEPKRTGARIEAPGAGDVLSPVHDHVHEPVPNLAGRAQRPGMVTIVPDSPPATEHTIDRPRNSYRQPGHSSRQTNSVIRFHHQMDVIGLYRKVHDAKPHSRRFPERPPHRDEHALPAQTTQPPRRSHRHVHRLIVLVLWTHPMRDAGPTVLRFPSGIGTLPPPSSKRKVLLHRSPSYLPGARSWVRPVDASEVWSFHS